jgi:ABC-type nitrate/sulfonate/bicarbonate transport system permease component
VNPGLIREDPLTAPPVSGPPRARPQSWWTRHSAVAVSATSLGIGLILWEFVGRFVVTDTLFFAPFSSVVAALWDLAVEGNLGRHIYISALEFAIGFTLAAVVGVGGGIVIGANGTLSKYLDPWIAFFYATPLVALTPFFILVFGIGVESKAALVFAVAVFPALISAQAGIRAVDARYLEVAHSFSLSRSQMFSKVLFPASLPFIVSGLRLASGRALTGVVVGELFFSSAGVGHLISIAAQTFNTAQLLAAVLIFALAGVVITGGLMQLERRLAPWRESTSVDKAMARG